MSPEAATLIVALAIVGIVAAARWFWR